MPDNIPQSDHDLLIRVHERVTAIQQGMDGQKLSIAQNRKDIEELQTWRARLEGQWKATARTSAIISSIISSVIASLIVLLISGKI